MATSSLPALFKPAHDQIAAKWPTLDDETKQRLIDNLPDHEERIAALNGNAILSTEATTDEERQGHQAIYNGLMNWGQLTTTEQIAVFMSGIAPVVKRMAAKQQGRAA